MDLINEVILLVYMETASFACSGQHNTRECVFRADGWICPPTRVWDHADYAITRSGRTAIPSRDNQLIHSHWSVSII
jgi:hypothetical protein